MSDKPNSERRRLRFSLANLLLFTTIVAICLGFAVRESQHARTIARLDSEGAKLASENRRLRNEVGELTIEDPTKVHAVRAPGAEPLTWKWRIWAPKGRAYRLRAIGGNIPKSGFPDAMSIPFHGGEERWCEYRIRQNPVDGTWEQTLVISETGPADIAGSPSGSDLTWPVEEPSWLEDFRGYSTSDAQNVGDFTRMFEPDRPVVLLRRRVSKTKPIPDPSPGFMVWFEPAR